MLPLIGSSARRAQEASSFLVRELEAEGRGDRPRRDGRDTGGRRPVTCQVPPQAAAQTFRTGKSVAELRSAWKPGGVVMLVDDHVGEDVAFVGHGGEGSEAHDTGTDELNLRIKGEQRGENIREAEAGRRPSRRRWRSCASERQPRPGRHRGKRCQWPH